MSDSQGRPTSPKPFTEIEVLSQDPELPQEEDPEVLPVYPYQGKQVFRAKEMGDYFISQLQQQYDKFNDFKSNTTGKIDSIQTAIGNLTVLLEQSLGRFNKTPPQPKSSTPPGQQAPGAGTQLPPGTFSYRPHTETSSFV